MCPTADARCCGDESFVTSSAHRRINSAEPNKESWPVASIARSPTAVTISEASGASSFAPITRPVPSPTASRELRVERPPLCCPHAAGRERDQPVCRRLLRHSQQPIDRFALGAAGEQARAQLLTRRRCVRALGSEAPESLGVMAVVAIRYASRVEPAAGRRRKPDARPKSRETRECGAPHRALGEVRNGLTVAAVRRTSASRDSAPPRHWPARRRRAHCRACRRS